VFDRPVMPDFAHEITLRNLRIGNDFADVTLRKSNNSVLIDLLHRSPGCSVVCVA
jgi:hypothetical protein